ncbi:MAG TPA: hypothetical protein VM580_02665 [Labilithrix sp.]|nr:hypothetical protein [Labilithrix sp.]
MRGHSSRSPRPASTAKRALVLAFVALALGAGAGSTACGPEPIGVEACRKIERVRCESAPGCGIEIRLPHAGDTAESDVAACIRYYDDQCLHGLVIEKDPAPQDVDACVNAIITGDCSVVRSPETHTACAFLNPPPPAPAPDAAASDAGTLHD